MTELATRNGPATMQLLVQLEQTGKLTRTRLDLSGVDLTYEQYESIGVMLGALRDTSAWALGDWLIFGEGTYGEKYAQAAEATGRSKSTLTDWYRVAMFVAPNRRREDLTWSHHRLVAKLSPREQRSWLTKAANNGWTREELAGQMDSGGSSDSGTGRESTHPVHEDLMSVLRLLDKHGQPDGNGYVLVPVDVWARVQSVLGKE
jgi:hypothetical protein